jgi:hypothetical protein
MSCPPSGDLPVNKITPSAVRAWHRPLADRIPTTAAKCHRILKAILATAVEDQLIAQPVHDPRCGSRP